MSRQSQSKACNAVDKNHPGYFAVAGPFNVSHKGESARKAEKAACVRTHRDQFALDPAAKVVMCGREAWVIRKLPLIANTKNSGDEVRGMSLGIKGGRALGGWGQ